MGIVAVLSTITIGIGTGTGTAIGIAITTITMMTTTVTNAEGESRESFHSRKKRASRQTRNALEVQVALSI